MDKKKEHIINQFTQLVGYVPNIDNPKSFNEKIQWLKLYYRDPLLTKCADKYAVRDYIKNKIGEKYLIPLLGVYENANLINFDKLPNKFVLKVNNGSGKNIICKNKEKLDIDKTRNKLNGWLKPKNFHYLYDYEWAYKNIKPKIICEKLIEDKNSKLLDYKILCFHGKAKYIWVDINRYICHKRNVYSLKWKKIDLELGYPQSLLKIPKPKKLKSMIDLAELLSKDFPLVRVDLYFVENIIYFGELTFTSGNGNHIFKPKYWDLRFGKLLKLNNIHKNISFINKLKIKYYQYINTYV